MTEEAAGEAWADAAHRVVRLTSTSQPIRFLSLQASLVVMIAFLSALSVVAAFGEPSEMLPLQLVLLGAGVILGIAGYVKARRRGRLLPFFVARTGTALEALTAEERKALNRQWRRTTPMQRRSVPLITALIAYQQRNNNALVLSLIGAGCTLLGIALAQSPVFATVTAGCVVLVTLISLWEAGRLRRLAHDASALDQ